ncbi:MAG: hypothetical protein WCP98_14125 [Actinomycetes bacterium]
MTIPAADSQPRSKVTKTKRAIRDKVEIVTFTNAKGESMKFNKPFGQLIGFADGTSLSF